MSEKIGARTLSVMQLRRIENISFEEFEKFYQKNISTGESYILEKHEMFCDSIARFLMDLDDDSYNSFKKRFFSRSRLI